MKRVFASLIVLLALVGAGVAVRFQISTDAAVRRMAAMLVPGAGERKIVVGRTSIRFFPRLAIGVEDVAIVAGDGMARLTVPRVQLDLAVLPLLAGETAISRLHLDEPQLEVRAPFTLDGLLPERATMAAMPPASVVVHKGTVRLLDRDSRESEIFSDVEANLRWPRALGNLSLDASATWRGAPVSLLVQGLSPPRLASGDTGDLDVNLRMPGLDALFSGKALLSDRLMLDGRLSAAIDDPRGLADYLRFRGDAASASIPGLPAIALDGRLRSQGWLASLNDAHLRIGNAAADGFLSLQIDTPRPQLRGTLAFGSVTIGTAGDAGSLAPWLDWTPDLEGYRDFDLDLRFSISRALLGDVRAANMAASLLVSNGQIHADIGDAQIFGGNGSVILRGGIEARALNLSGRFSLGSASLATLRLIVPIAILPKLGGSLNLSGDFNTSGNSLRTLLAALTGRARLDAAQATLEHLATPNLTMASLGSEVAQRLAGQLVVSPGISGLMATIGFAGPDLTIAPVTLALAEADVDLRGRISLANRKIDLLGTIRLPPPDTAGDTASSDATSGDRPTADVSLVGTLDAAVVAVRDRTPVK